MYGKIKEHLQKELQTIEDNGILKKKESLLHHKGRDYNFNRRNCFEFCSNNYLGLSSHPEVVQAAKDTLDTHGFGMSSVRFICGTQDIHKTLEKKFPILWY
jgi:glycine C-acetyltransferase